MPILVLLLLASVDVESDIELQCQPILDATKKYASLDHDHFDAMYQQVNAVYQKCVDRVKAEARSEQAFQDRQLAQTEHAKVRQERIATNARDPNSVRLALSVEACWCATQKANALQGIRDEKSRSRIAGVTNLSTLDELQTDVVTDDDCQKEYQRMLRDRRLAPMGCSTKRVSAAVRCISEQVPANGDCDDLDWIPSVVEILSKQ